MKEKTKSKQSVTMTLKCTFIRPELFLFNGEKLNTLDKFTPYQGAEFQLSEDETLLEFIPTSTKDVKIVLDKKKISLETYDLK